MVLPGNEYDWGLDAVDISRDMATGISLPAAYAMSGTDLANRCICLCACFAMSGTDLAYGAAMASKVMDMYQGSLFPGTMGSAPLSSYAFPT
eukprot:3435600-Rhodomonas_salina.4